MIACFEFFSVVCLSIAGCGWNWLVVIARYWCCVWFSGDFVLVGWFVVYFDL